MVPDKLIVADDAEGRPVNEPLILPKPVLFPAAGAKVAATNFVLPDPLTTKFKVGALYPPKYPTFTIVTEPAFPLKYSLTAYGV